MSAKTVLIIDDDADVRWALGAILDFEGYHVLEAVSGQEGVDLVRAHQPDLVLMDLEMPGLMDGYAAAKALRSDPRTGDIPIVVVTGYPVADPDRAAARQSLFHSVLPKPVVPTKLREHVRAVIGKP
jgi:CheY-like chemotaxis protein